MERRSLRSRSRSRRRVKAGRSRSPSATRERLHTHGRSRTRSRRSQSPPVRDWHEISRSPPTASVRPRQRIGQRPCWYAKEYDPIQVGSIDGTDTAPHDRALVRAINTPFDPSRDAQVQGDPYATLFVGRLSFATTEETMRTTFEAFGRIRRVRLVRDIVTQESKGYAFIEFERERDFRVAYQTAHRTVIDGRTILVDYERSRVMPGWKPRRLGGGLGGKKESGQLRFGGRDHPFKPPR